QVSRIYAASRHALLSAPLGDLLERHGDRLQILSVDSTLESDVVRLANEVRERDQRLHWLINCAGLLHDSARSIRPEKRLEQVDIAQLEALFRINTFAPILLAKHFLPLLNHDQPACFASLSARVGSISDNHLGGWYSYRASKAAQNQFIRTFAIEAQRRAPNLTCLALHPGTTDTGLSKPFQKNVPGEKLFSTAYVAEQLLDIVFSRPAADSGKFLAWDNSEIMW
ncbi:MAG: SDR family NAD(P)-dependent oxidoreductase, partial [Alcanivoracaceae bacterium]|nr:SDR family NAD(P)-dependent oxidoreductase [Alcanivoracaceae bacterium]